jgi:hypothetical protein
MPSSLIVRCTPIKDIRPHPNADNLIILDILGWQVLENKDTNPKVGDLRVFIPPDSILPDSLATELGVTKYLRKDNRVGQVKLRGEMSFGISADNRWGFEDGDEVSAKLGITKYEAPPPTGAGDEEVDHPLFSNYCNIENYRNYPDLFKEGEEVVYLEKIDGTNSKVGGIRVPYEEIRDHRWAWSMWTDDDGGGYTQYGLFMIGSHRTRRKLLSGSYRNQSLYQFPIFTEGISGPIRQLVDDRKANVVIFYGEICGRISPKQMKYDTPNDLKYVCFDIYVDGKYLDWDDFYIFCYQRHVPTVPILYKGPFHADEAKMYANGRSRLSKDPNHISEGIIIRPVKESTYERGRKILKLKSDAYEELKAKGKVTEFS